jgi:hypothetical protein
MLIFPYYLVCRKRNSYGERLTAFFNPHASGNHTFFITSDDEGGLWFSSGNNITNVNNNKYGCTISTRLIEKPNCVVISAS